MGVSTVLKDYGTDILDAIRGNNLPRLQLILEKQLKSNHKIARVCLTDIKHRPSKKFACPLILAARQEDPQILQWMMHKGVDPNFVHHTIYSSKRREDVTALHIAVDLGFYDTVEVLLGANADCNIGDHKQETPLHIAVKKADRIMCQMLLSKGADPTIPDSIGNAALHIATLYGHLLLVKTLLKYDADIFQKGADGAIPPHIAAKEGHVHLMHLFCTRHLGNVNIKIPCYADQREKAPLHMSAENGHKEIAHILIDQYEAEVNVRDSDGNTALHCCVLNPYDPHRMREKEDFYETAKILVKNRVSINAKNAFGDTALHLAAMNRFQRIVELLLEVGANPFVENDEKLKPIDVVPEDDPVTKQVLKTAMLRGPPRQVNLSIETLNRDMSGSLMNWSRPPASKTSQADNRTGGRKDSLTDSNEMRERTPDRDEAALDRSLSVSSSQRTSTASMPSVFGEEQGVAAKNNKPPQAPNKARQNLGKTRGVDGAVLGEGQTKKGQGMVEGQGQREGQGQSGQKPKVPSEYTQMSNVRMRKKPGREMGHEEDDSYSFLSASQSSLRDGSTQTLDSASRDRGIQVSRGERRKKSENKQMQTNFADESLDETMSRASDVYSVTSEYTEYSEQPAARSRDPKQQSRDQKQQRRDRKRPQTDEYEDDKVIYENFAGVDLDESMQSIQSTSDYGRPVRKTAKQYKIEKTRNKYRQQKHRTSSDMSDDVEMSQVAQYQPMAAAAANEPVPGSVKVNNVPGRPGTIELQYSGGPITIALDTQAFNQMPQDDHGDYFYDSAGNKYPVSLITALQKASLLNKTPIVTAQVGTQVQEIYQTPTKVDKATGREQIYMNQDELSALLNSSIATTTSLATTEQDTTLDATQDSTQPGEVTATISDAIHELTKTPAKTPVKSPRHVHSPAPILTPDDRSTPTRRTPTRQTDHLSKILGKARVVRRGNMAAGNIQQGDEAPVEPIQQQETVELQASDETDSSDDEMEVNDIATQADDVTSPDAQAPPLPDTSPPKDLRIPPQKKERKKKSTKAKEKSPEIESTQIVDKRMLSQGSESTTSPDIWDQSPNSPPFKTFSEKMAWAKALEQGKQPEPITQTQREKKPRPPLTSVSQEPIKPRGRPSDIEEESEEESSSSESSETGSESESEADDNERARADGQASASGEESVVQKAREIDTVHMETVEVVEMERREKRVERTESLELVARSRFDRENEIENEIQQYDIEHNIRTLDRVVSPPARRSDAQTPDSMYSDTSLGGGVLNLRVSGPTPKAYAKNEKDAARVAWMMARPERIESASEASDNEFGSRYSLNRSTNSLDRSLSPAGQERSKRWSEETKSIYRKQTPTGTVATKRPPSDSSDINAERPKPAPRGKVKLIGSYARPYKSIGDFDVKTDLIEEAMMTSPFSPMSPIHTAIEEEESPHEVPTFTANNQQFHLFDDLESKVTSIPMIEKEVAITEQAEIQQPTPVKAKTLKVPGVTFSDPTELEQFETEDANEEMANTSISGKTFKKNIKIYEQGPEEYETEQAQQDVAMDPELVALANKEKRRKKEKHRKKVTVKESKVENGVVMETLTTTVVTSHAVQPQVAVAEIVKTDDESFDDESESDEETDKSASEIDENVVENKHAKQPVNEQSMIADQNKEKAKTELEQSDEETDDESDEELAEYEMEPGARRPRTKPTARPTQEPPAPPPYDSLKPLDATNTEAQKEELVQDDVYKRYGDILRGQASPAGLIAEARSRGKLRRSADEYIAEGQGHVPVDEDELAALRSKDVEIVDVHMISPPLQHASIADSQPVQDTVQEISLEPHAEKTTTKKIKDKTKTKKTKTKKLKSSKGNTEVPTESIVGSEIQPTIEVDILKEQQDVLETEKVIEQALPEVEPLKKKKKKIKDGTKIKKKKKSKDSDVSVSGSSTAVVENMDILPTDSVHTLQSDDGIEFEEYGAEPGARKRHQVAHNRPDPNLVAQVLMNQSDSLIDDVMSESDLEEYEREPGARRAKQKPAQHLDDQAALSKQPMEISEKYHHPETLEHESGVGKPTHKAVSHLQDTSLGFESFELNIGPEDEEVAQINHQAAERRKTKKEKKKKHDKQQKQWADEQKTADEKLKKGAKISQPQIPTETAEVIKPMETQKIQGQIEGKDKGQVECQSEPEVVVSDTVLPPGYHKTPPPQPAVEITFEGIAVIDQTKKSKSKSKTEDGEKVKKKKKKKEKDGTETKKKKKKTKLDESGSEVSGVSSSVTAEIKESQSTEEIEEYITEPGMRRRKKKPHFADEPVVIEIKPSEMLEAAREEQESPVTAEHTGVLTAKALKNVKSLQYVDSSGSEASEVAPAKVETLNPDVIQASLDRKDTAMSSLSEFSTDAHFGAGEKVGSLSSLTSGEEMEGIVGTVMGAKVDRNDTVKRNEGEGRAVVIRRRQVSEQLSEEEEFEEGSEFSEYSDEEENEYNMAEPHAPAQSQHAPVVSTNASDLQQIPGVPVPTPSEASAEKMEEEPLPESMKPEVKEDLDQQMWQQYQRQKSHDSQEHPMAAVEGTNIDDSVEETNIDSETESETESESEYSDEEEPLPQQGKDAHSAFQREQGGRVSMRNKPRQKQDAPSPIETHPQEKPRPVQSEILALEGPEWRDQTEQQERMRQILASYQDYHTQYAKQDPGSQAAPHVQQDPGTRKGQSLQRDPGSRRAADLQRDQGTRQGQSLQRDPGLQRTPGGSHRIPREYVPRHEDAGQVHTTERPRAYSDYDHMSQMWAQQHPPPPGGHFSQQKRRPQEADPHQRRKKVRLPGDNKEAISDTEMTSSNRRRRKHARFAELHSESEMFDLEPPKAREPGKSLQEAALESLKVSLENQPKVAPRRPLESLQRPKEKPINYTRGVYRPQPVHWRGSRGTTMPMSGRYDDSQLTSQAWLDHQGDVSMTTESEGEVDEDVVKPRTDPRIHAASQGQAPYDPRQGRYDPRQHGRTQSMPEHYDRSPHLSQSSLPHPNYGGAFQPVQPGPKRVKIFERQKKREARGSRRQNRDEPIKSEPGPVDFSQYPPTAKLWMEQVDTKTVQKSKTMYLSVMPEGLKPPPELENNVPKYENLADDVFLPPQWVIARGRSLRKRKHKLDRQRESMGSLSAGVTSGESDVEGMDRPLSPGRQMLLFFRVGSNWKDLAWILMDGIQKDAETVRMVKDIQLKHPDSLTEQVHDMMHRWWKKNGQSATIEELRRALDIVNVPYIEEEYFNQGNRGKSITSYTESEDDLDVSQISDVDPDVSRLMQEYERRSPNRSFDVLGAGSASNVGSAPHLVSVESLARRMKDKGITIDRSRLDSKLSAASRDSVFKRNSQYSERYESGDSFDEYLSDGDHSRRSFLIVQPQLKQEDYNYETQI